MYKAIKSGSATDENGRHHRFDAGDPVDAPEGSLDSCKSVIWIDEKDQDYEEQEESEHPVSMDNTKDEIRGYMDEQGVDYNNSDTKKELLNRLD